MTAVAVGSSGPTGLLGWWKSGTDEGRRALVAAGLGWMLDSFDVMLYALVLASIMSDLRIPKETAGLLGSATLLASAAGGIIFGIVADRYGRTRALIGSVLIYSVFTAACGFAQSATQLAIFRILLGIGMGGEWASGAALVSENVGASAPWQSARTDAERLGDWVRPRRGGYHDRAAPVGLARRLLRGHSAGVLHPLDPPSRRRAGHVA
jgi:hypothetical protein